MLIGYEQIAERVGVKLDVLYNWRSRGKMPEPTIDTRQPLWDERIIDEWISDKEGTNAGRTREGSR